MTSSEQAVTVKEALKLGYDAFASKQYDKAANIAKAILQKDNQVTPAHFLMGLVATDTQLPDIAISAFNSVVTLDQDHAAAWAHIAHHCMKSGLVGRAENAIQHLRRIRSDDPMVLNLMGQTLTLMGEHTLALNCYGRAHNIAPENIMFMHNLANTLIFDGKTEEAEKMLATIIELEPHSPQAHWLIAGARKAVDKSHINQMHQLTAQFQNNHHATAFYQYALGKEYEDLQDWDNAFAAFAKGANAKRQVVSYNEQDEIDAFDYLKKHFTESWLTDGQEGNPDPSPIFVLGQPRTGTTLIERIITAHSEVHSAGELQQLRLAVVRLGGVQTPKPMALETFAAALELDPKSVADMYLQSSGRMRGDKPRFVDKLPQNYMMLPLILKALPNAKIIHLVRSPMDACFASYKQLFAETYHHSYDQAEMARHHLRYLDLMSVWRDRFGERFLDISYEDTTRDLEPNVKRLIQFLDLPWQEQCLNFYQQKSAVSTASAVQVRQPVHTRSIGRWRRYERQLQPMRDIIESAGIAIVD